MHDYPEFADPMQRPRYSGIPTFMRAPLSENFDGVDVALVGVPFDGGVTNRTGARHGPREIRNQSSLMRRINQATGVNPYDCARVADVGDAWVQSPYNLESSLGEIEEFYRRLHAAGIVPVSAGGDHSVSSAAYAVGYSELFALITWTSVGLMGATAAVAGQNLGAGKPERSELSP